jgi:hypothetical protein
MATGYLLLFPGGYGSDGTANSVAAAPELQVSSTAAASNKPKLHRMRLAFDQTTDEHWFFGFKMPGDYASGGTLRGSFSTTATTGTVLWKAGIGEASGNNSDDSFLAADLSGGGSGDSVSGTANTEVEFTIGLTMTSIAANDPVTLFIGRDADSATDSTAADVYLNSLTLEYVPS